MNRYDWLVVGAGFAGAVTAERLASQLGQRVLVIDRRSHIGGNAYDELDEHGIRVHRYGPHIFHTNSDTIVEYLSGFTAWRPYEHRVLAHVGDELLPIPINRTTVNRLYGLDLCTEQQVAAFHASRALARTPARTSEDVVIGTVGRELYDLFFRGYTRKQWGLDPSELDASVTARVPIRLDDDDRYFTDRHQAMPLHGYTALFDRLLDHPRITVETGVALKDVPRSVYRRCVYTGPIDEYFGRRFGPLPYRSLRFVRDTLLVSRALPVATVNEPDEAVPFTRTTEMTQLTGQVHACTTLVREYPQGEGEPYYPIPRPENEALYRRYKALADATDDTWFVGRLATYRYYNMDQVVGQALATFRRIAESTSRVA
jgi:UDP-galactopyranose mutase